MHWRTQLVQPQALARSDFHSLAVPTHRGSTVLFDDVASVADSWRHQEKGYTYGLYGSPTVLELGARVGQLEGALQTFVVPGGQAAIVLVYLALCAAGSHVLVPHSVYGPNKALAGGMLTRLGIEVECYDPLAGADIATRIRHNTALVWTESPGSVTMEVQDVPAICAAAHARGVPVALDNTYAAGVLFDAFAHGVDVSLQALTKYVGGHSDLLLGTVSVRDAAYRERIGDTYKELGLNASPDDCSLALRGLQTLGVRLRHLEQAALEIAQWLAARPEVHAVLHPALPTCPGHALWKRDFKGSASVFSVLLNAAYSQEQVNAFVNALRLFRIGWSWGGLTSLVMAYPDLDRPAMPYPGRVVRFNVGFEEVSDLKADLAQALAKALG
jgi:cystathionine beta-lyase